jgi:hypothetical protein
MEIDRTASRFWESGSRGNYKPRERGGRAVAMEGDEMKFDKKFWWIVFHIDFPVGVAGYLFAKYKGWL